MGPYSADAADTPLVPRIATFFALYQDPIGLSDGTCFCIAEEGPVVGLPSKIGLHYKEGEPTVFLDPDAHTHELLFVSIRFHRGIRRQDFITEHVSQLTEVVQRVGGAHFNGLDSLATSEAVVEEKAVQEKYSAYTVVEMTTPVVIQHGTQWEACSLTDYVAGPTLTRCLTYLARVISAYRGTEKITMPSPASERVGPVIILATRPANPDDGEWDPEVTSVINTFATSRQPMLRGDHKPNTLDGMAQALAWERIGHPSIALGNIQNEMDVALHDGNFRGVIMSAHSASEVLLDLALMGMLFEESKTPEMAVTVFDRPLKSRLLSEYHERLGGAWTVQRSRVVAAWVSDLLLLRHRVAHAGYVPSSEEAEAAQKAHYALGAHLRDRLAVKAKKYPFTAGVLVTRHGFDRRNIKTKAAAEAVKAATFDTVAVFASWRGELMRLRTGA